MRYFFLSFCLSLFSCQGLAGEENTSPIYHGFYLGGSLGYDYAELGHQFNYHYETSHGPSTLDGRIDAVMDGLVGGAFIGYSLVLNSMGYVGIEILGNASTATGNDKALYEHTHDDGIYDQDGFNNITSIKYNFGVSVLPGILINSNALFYARLGYSRIHVSGNERSILYANPVTPATVVTSHPYAVSLNGFSYGFGLETGLAQHLHTRLELIHTDYNSLMSALRNPFTLSDNQAMAGILYRV